MDMPSWRIDWTLIPSPSTDIPAPFLQSPLFELRWHYAINTDHMRNDGVMGRDGEYYQVVITMLSTYH